MEGNKNLKKLKVILTSRCWKEIIITRARGNDTPHTLVLIVSNGDFVSDVANPSPLVKGIIR